MDYKSLAEQLVKRCLKKGADAAEVYIESGRELSIEVRNGDIETVQEAATAGAGSASSSRGGWPSPARNDLREAALDEAIARAIGFAKITTADKDNVLPDDKATTDVEGLYDPAIATVPIEKKDRAGQGGRKPGHE